MTFAAKVRAPFAVLGIETDENAVTAIRYLPLHERASAPRTPTARRAVAQLERYLDDPAFRFTLPLAPRGTVFQQRVWDAIAAIPVSESRTYAEIGRIVRSSADPGSGRQSYSICNATCFAFPTPCSFEST